MAKRTSEEQKTKETSARRLREAYQRGDLTEDQIIRLEAIGFEFEAKPHKRAVICYETGEVFESAAAAARIAGVSKEAILSAIKHKRMGGGYHWYCADEPKPDPSEFAKSRKKAVLCIETNEVFESARAASKAVSGIAKNGIDVSIKYNRKWGGYSWRYVSEEEFIQLKRGKEQNDACVEQIVARVKRGNRDRAVVCWETGVIYKSTSEAARAIGVTVAAVRLAARTKGTAGKYHWYYADEPKPDPSELKRSAKRAVVCVETGEVFESASAAAKFCKLRHSSSIPQAIERFCCAGGYHWRDATEEEVTQLRNETPND